MSSLLESSCGGGGGKPNLVISDELINNDNNNNPHQNQKWKESLDSTATGYLEPDSGSGTGTSKY